MINWLILFGKSLCCREVIRQNEELRTVLTEADYGLTNTARSQQFVSIG